MKASKSSQAMKIAHQIKTCFNSFSEALKAAWMYVKSGKENPTNLNVISWYCSRNDRAKREEQLKAKQAAFAKKQSLKNKQKSLKNNTALKVNREKMNALSNGKKIKATSTDDDGFYSLNREWSDYEMDMYL